jgi:hypothetical protein
MLTVVLVIHIYQVSNRPRGGVDGWQMARVNFEKSVDSTGIVLFRYALHQHKSVYHSFPNMQAGTLAFAFDPTKTKASELCNSVVQKTGIQATLLRISSEEAANACPVIDQHSITYRISSGLQKLFR